MKKLNLLGLLAGVFCSTLSLISFTSCDDDVSMSVVLSGDWEGNFGMYYDYYDRHGRFVETFDCYDTDISFYPDYDYATRGYGYQVDFYEYGPYAKIYHSFDWEVVNESVYLYYIGESELNTVIREFRLTDGKFSGYFDNSNSRFTLYKYRGYYDWHGYWNDCGHNGYYYYDRAGWYDNYYRSTRSAAPANNEASADKAEEIKAEGKDFTIRYGNRFNEK